jgi:hypothetical protein
VPQAWRTVARKATPTALYWLVLSLITFLGISAVIQIEATRTRLFLVVLVVGVAFSAAYFLERSLRDYVRTDIQPNGEPSAIGSPNCEHHGDQTSSLPKWLNRNREPLGAKDRGNGERPKAAMGILAKFFNLFWGWADYNRKDWSSAPYKRASSDFPTCNGTSN